MVQKSSVAMQLFKKFTNQQELNLYFINVA